MKKQSRKSTSRNTGADHTAHRTLHPGSSRKDAKAIGGAGDFGVPESDVTERDYTSENTKRSDPGNAVPRSGSDESRTSGVGGNNSGPGSSSGGDLDPDVDELEKTDVNTRR